MNRVFLFGLSLAALCLTAISVQANEGESASAPVYDKPYIGEMETYKAKYEDTLVEVARRENLGFVELRSANPALDPWMPGRGTEILLPARHLLPDGPREGIVINLPEMRLYAFVEPGEPPVTHPIGIGREGLETPTGKTEVVRKMIGPVWRPTERMREEDPGLPEAIGPGADNPMGTHAIYLGWPQYAIHGTNRPYGIGRRVSSGCIRMYPEDIVSFYKLVEVGTPVTVLNQPIKLAWVEDVLYMEAHPGIEQATFMEKNGGFPDYRLTTEDIRRITKAAGEYADDLDWAVIRKVVKDRNGYPVRIARISQGAENIAQNDRIVEAVNEDEPKPEEEAAVQEEQISVQTPEEENVKTAESNHVRRPYNP